MGTLDLDAARAARAEANRERHSIVFSGETFQLPVELPADFAFRLVEGEARQAIEVLLDPADCERFWDLRPSIEDLAELAQGVARLYGFGTAGESSASAGSSSANGKPSRRTSKRTTASTSATPALASVPSGSGASGPS